MAKTEREVLQEVLERIQDEVDGVHHVYYQPPESVKMSYPCFVYKLNTVNQTYGSDKPYLYCNEYLVTYITRDPEPVMVEMVKPLPQVRYDRHFTANNLHHYAFLFTGMLMWQPTTKAIRKIASEFLGE